MRLKTCSINVKNSFIPIYTLSIQKGFKQDLHQIQTKFKLLFQINKPSFFNKKIAAGRDFSHLTAIMLTLYSIYFVLLFDMLLSPAILYRMLHFKPIPVLHFNATLVLHFKPIPGAPHGFNVARITRIIFDFFT